MGVIKPVLQHAEKSSRQQPVVDLSNALYTAQLITGNMTRGNYSAVLLVSDSLTHTDHQVTKQSHTFTRKSLHFSRSLLESNFTSSSGIEPRFHGRRPRSPVTIPTELCRLGTDRTTVPVLTLF